MQKFIPISKLKSIKEASSVASINVNRRIDKVCAHIRTESQLRLLYALYKAPEGLTSRKCANESNILGPAVSRMIRADNLLRIEKLITVDHSDLDNRVLVIKLTAKGKREVDRYNGK